MTSDTSSASTQPTTPRVFGSVAELTAAIGEDLGSGDWLEITQERVNAFADATGDHQWIHVDPVRAADGPFGAPIAHGYLTLSLLPVLAGQIFTVTGPKLVINYGLNKVRFPNPVVVGKRIRANAVITEVTETKAGVNVVVSNTVEIEGEAKPACVAENVRVLVF
ncbi:MaoC family dehydratase [Gordonia sp. ABSL1-1]|uniref:MaoC family dehydratase n=1 Tax=Gordonia sp. ABSL1-1 TaxID=3053923 RepID=UPI002572F07D|nr:MaoC family dehydratase [Gordonia sp. ABSL1-1]MDL9936931.1 MaoC family dehydratase [Gordonia sp. ABSL1-1]